jgi:hypothetical protein
MSLSADRCQMPIWSLCLHVNSTSSAHQLSFPSRLPVTIPPSFIEPLPRCVCSKGGIVSTFLRVYPIRPSSHPNGLHHATCLKSDFSSHIYSVVTYLDHDPNRKGLWHSLCLSQIDNRLPSHTTQRHLDPQTTHLHHRLHQLVDRVPPYRLV